MSGLTYSNSVPASGHWPGDDQGPMQTNFASIQTLIDRDHVDFTSENYGMHEQVEIPNVNVPTFPGSGNIIPTIFTNTQDGAGNTLPGSIPELFFYTGVVGSSKNQCVCQANGSILLFGGIILKWGTGTANAAGSSNSFTAAFPNSCFSVVASSTSSIGNSVYISAKSASAFTAQTSGSTSSIYYIAIGN